MKQVDFLQTAKRAREDWNKALVLYKEVGMPDQIAQTEKLLKELGTDCN